MPEQNTTQPSKSKVSFSFDLRVIVVLLLLVIAGMLALWRPWEATSSSDQTIEVTGEATLTDSPDEFVFYPSYEFKNADKTAALAAMTEKSGAIVAKLKELGVPDSKIKTNSSNYDYPVYYFEDKAQEPTYTLQLTITLSSLEEAQKIQDYLVSTTPSGAVSPQASFSDAKRKELESKARDEATKDARSKADQMAKNLGFKVGKVKTVTDGSGFGIMPYAERGALDTAVSSSTSLAVQPGENELSYSVTVTYFLR